MGRRSARPDVDESRLRAIRASSVSGDWRPINGGLELVAISAVNVPGIPIPPARVASGLTVALVAAGVEPLVDLALEESLGVSIDEQIRTGLTEVYDRLEAIESRPDITMTAAERREAVSEAIQAVSTDREAHIESLRRNVHKEAVAASLRSKVHG